MGGTSQVLAALAPADPNHWNVLNDPVYPSCLECFRAKPLTGWDIDVRVNEVMNQVHDLSLQWMQEMGLIRGIDHDLSKSLMVEFFHLQILMGEDLSATLRAWQVDMEAAMDNLLRDLDAAAQVSTTPLSREDAIRATLQQFRAAVQLRVAFPLTRLEEARKIMEAFIRTRIREMLSQQETKDLVGELSSQIADHRGKAHQLVQGELLRHPEVAPRVLVGLAAERPLESNFFPGILEGLLGSLGIAATGESDPPPSSREGARHAWSTAVGEALSWIEQKGAKVPVPVGLPPSLDPAHLEDLHGRQRDLIPPPLTDPLFIPGMARALFKALRPPVVPKESPTAGSQAAVPSSLGPVGGGPEPEAFEPMDLTPSTSQPCLQVPELSSSSDTDSGKTEEVIPEEAPPPRSLKVRLPLALLKHSHETMAGGSKDGATPSKVRKEPGAKESETAWLTGPSKADLSNAHFELYQKNHVEVRDIRPQILELDDRDDITQEVLDSSLVFCLRRAADESYSPTIIGEHWIYHLESEGRIARCKPNDFLCEEGWLPLYTRASITKYVSGVSSLIETHRDSPLIAVIPPGTSFQLDHEYVIHQLHEAECLSRITIYYGDGQRKQLAFCPYCGVMYENSAMAESCEEASRDNLLLWGLLQ